MPRVPTISPATGNPTPAHFIHTLDSQFVDSAGRTLLLRGVNLSGADKAPLGEPSYKLEGFWETGERGEGNFVGRPLNLDDGSADVHLARLRGWGFNMLRYVVPWEALEHAGPGKYDHEFMDYTVRALRKCKEYGFKVYMDPHQDVWSRFSGGSGAPYWTLIACGFNPRNFTPTQTAIVHCEYPSVSEPAPECLPAMIWSTNYAKLASQTLFTLFFSGRKYAPKCIIDGENIQDYLQRHYIAAFGALADRMRDAGDLLDECVIGWDSMNEPFEGFCGYEDLNVVPTKQGSALKKGAYPSPAQSLRLGMGQAQTVDRWKFGSMGSSRDGTVTIDPQGLKMWADPASEPGGTHPVWGWTRDAGWQLGTCIWAQHGVWDVASGAVLAPDYFRTTADHTAHFIETHWLPHWQVFAARVRAAHPEAILFVAPPVFWPPPAIAEDALRGRCCYSAHYYDGLTLVSRHWNWVNADALGLIRGKYSSTLPAVRIGESAIRKSLQEQLGYLKADAPILGAYPTIIGEIGIPYDMDGKRAYGYTDGGKYKGDYGSQQKALDASLNAADGANALSYTIWNYCPDNSHRWGDLWNLEDLSIWSADDLKERGVAPTMRDDSRAMLLKGGTAAPSAAVSSVSLATLSADVRDETSTKTLGGSTAATSLFATWENAYDFLTDGARAVKAFSRPYPVATVGVPTDIRFDIDKAEFTLVVAVQAVDAPLHRDDDGAEEPATEIFLPLVHYASARLLGLATAQEDEQEEDEPERECATPETISVVDVPVAAKDKDSSPSVLRSGSLASDSSDSSAASASSARLFVPRATPLALQVDVSAGRWAAEGQLLRWWYPVPAADEPPQEYRITVRRAGGAIKAEVEGAEGLWAQLCACLSGMCRMM